MNTPELFILGAIVTAIVAVALGLVLYGAIMDGRAPAAAVDDAEPVSPTPSESDEPRTPALTR